MLRTAVVSGLVGFLSQHASASKLSGSVVLNEDWDMEVEVMIDNDDVTITMKGPSDRFYGIGFGASVMADTYAIIAEFNEDPFEQKLGDHNRGAATTVTITEDSDDTADGVRTLVLSRARTSDDDDVFDFPDAAGTIALIYARGAAADDTFADNNHGGGAGAGTANLVIDYDNKYSGSVDLWAGVLSAKVYLYGTMAGIEICSNDPNWVGVEFCTSDESCDMPNGYAVILEGDADDAMERILGDYNAGETVNYAMNDEVSESEGVRCLMFSRECNVDEAAADLPCADTLADDQTAMVTRSLNGALGGQASLAKHIQTVQEIELEICEYTDEGEEDSDCLKATEIMDADDDDGDDSDEDGDNDDDDSAVVSSRLLALLMAGIAFAWNV